MRVALDGSVEDDGPPAHQYTVRYPAGKLGDKVTQAKKTGKMGEKEEKKERICRVFSRSCQPVQQTDCSPGDADHHVSDDVVSQKATATSWFFWFSGRSCDCPSG